MNTKKIACLLAATLAMVVVVYLGLGIKGFDEIQFQAALVLCSKIIALAGSIIGLGALGAGVRRLVESQGNGAIESGAGLCGVVVCSSLVLAPTTGVLLGALGAAAVVGTGIGIALVRGRRT